MKKIILSGAVLSASLSPLLVLAANKGDTSVGGILSVIAGLLAYVMPILITLAAVWFVYNVIMYMISGNEDKKKKAKEGVSYGLVGLLIIIAFWGIIRILMNTFNVGTTAGQNDIVPYVPVAPGAQQGGANEE